MGAKDPKQLHELFESYFNAKDLDALLTLYEDDAVLVAAPGATVQGTAAIREALEGFVAMNGTMTFIANADPIIAGDLGLMHGHWKLDVPGADAMEGTTAEVAHRGADGEWRYVLDNPWGSSVLDQA
jgi:ketosteroid isomerase-like protein